LRIQRCCGRDSGDLAIGFLTGEALQGCVDAIDVPSSRATPLPIRPSRLGCFPAGDEGRSKRSPKASEGRSERSAGHSIKVQRGIEGIKHGSLDREQPGPIIDRDDRDHEVRLDPR
jgi:hypothetical protein